MILENPQQSYQSNQHDAPNSIIFNFTNPQKESQLSRMKSQYHNKIRIRQLDKIRAEKRKIHQTNMTIEQILHNDFPKESIDAKNWACNLVALFTTSQKYQTDPFKLREIYLVAERFPSLGTLRLFYLAIINTSAQTIRTLFDLDVWRFLHNFLQHPPVKSQQKQIETLTDQQSYSPSSISSIKSTSKHAEIEAIKAAIQTFVCLYNKDVAFRDYSIGTHQTFTSYLKPVYRKYGDTIKTQVIYFMKAVFSTTPKEYSKQYIVIAKDTVKMMTGYYEKIRCCFEKNGWDEERAGESIFEVIKRAGQLSKVMSRLFEHINVKWLLDFIEGSAISKERSYLDIIHLFLSFGQWVLNKFYSNPNELSQSNQVLQSTIDFMNNTIMFYLHYTQKTTLDGESTKLIPEIIQSIVSLLNFIKKCEESKMFIQTKRQMMVEIETMKKTCLYAVDSMLNCQFDSYGQFVKGVVFSSSSEGEKVDLLENLRYLLDTEYAEKVRTQVINVIFTLLKVQVPHEELDRFVLLRQMMEKICEILADKLVIAETKLNICHQVLQFCSETEMHDNLGYQLRIKDVISKNFKQVEEFMYCQLCSSQLFAMLQQVVRLVSKDYCSQSLQNSVLI